ncbi:MAG: VOC family protein [Patescibacteria group bacterium]
MLKVSSILIGVSDLNKARPFYENVFGMKFEEFRPPFASAVLDGIEFNIEENASYRSSDWAELYIGGRKQVSFETDNLENFLKQAESLGAKIIKDIETKPWGWKEAIIADLDGNEFIIEQEGQEDNKLDI